MSIATSREGREQAAAKLTERSLEQLRDDLAYWSVAKKDHADKYAALTRQRGSVGELYAEAETWIELLADELQKRRPT